MRSMNTREMRSLLISVTASVLLLLLAIIAYFMIDVAVTTNRNIERNRELVIEQSVLTLTRILDEVKGMTTNAELFNLFNQDIVQDLLAGDMEAVYKFIVDFVTTVYPVDYVGVIADGKLVGYGESGGYDIEPSGMVLEPVEEEFDVIDELGDKEGLFISQFYDLDLKNLKLEPFSVNLIVDRTEEMAAVTDYFEDQRSDLLLRLSIAAAVAVILSILLTTVGLSYFTRKYVVQPIEELNKAAEDIAGGTYEGEVQVDPDSAYAALQGLLRSGQKVLSRMDEELKE